MAKEKIAFHGSDLEKIEEIYHIPKQEIIGFGANVNPLGLSPNFRQSMIEQIDCITAYPDREYKDLRKAMADYVNAPWEHILVGNGSTELITLFIKNKKSKKACLFAPSYAEYERELSLAGSEYYYYHLKEENDFLFSFEDFKKTLLPETDLLILCNPNNPTSTGIESDELKTLLTFCKEKKIFVIIDETYVEFVPEHTCLSAVPLTSSFENLVVLRGVSKFFAAPGLRLGYAICSDTDLLAHLNTIKDPWTVHSLADTCGVSLFTDTAYMKKTQDLINSERIRICLALDHFKTVKYYDPKANFILIKLLDPSINSSMVFEHCIKKGLMIRDCSTFPDLEDRFIRFCFMLPEQNDKLLETLSEILS